MLQLKQLMHKSLLVVVGSVALALSSIADSSAGNTDFAKTKSDKCVADTAYMRTNHMQEMLHQRDDTMRKGIRDGKHSLKACINCHIPENSQVRFGDDKHFCSGCHNYAAVSIDCFQCHADRPTSDNKRSSNMSSFPHYADNPAKGVSK
ncbi:MAG: hypothetical protein OQL06_14680 [Gammaproteobacteria bacterium]|nr:hypothetical protein [Gammaproteobacteria bacterium]